MRRPTLTFAWSEEMSVGIPEIDEDHQKFILLINDLNRAITDRMSPPEIKHRLQLVIDDAVRHFSQEEKLFNEWHYPDTRQHANIHAEVINSLKVINKKFVPYGNDSEWMDAGVQVKKILVDHILKEDASSNLKCNA
jgi:hemerythrin-like metal-binding protein